MEKCAARAAKHFMNMMPSIMFVTPQLMDISAFAKRKAM
jgi:hypothetical protein